MLQWTNSRMIRLGLLLTAACLSPPLLAEEPEAPDAAVAVDMSLEDLLNVEITSAARKSQRLNDVAAAVYVITREDIERSGATNIPEALRLAPGSTSHAWRTTAGRSACAASTAAFPTSCWC